MAEAHPHQLWAVVVLLQDSRARRAMYVRKRLLVPASTLQVLTSPLQDYRGHCRCYHASLVRRRDFVRDGQYCSSNPCRRLIARLKLWAARDGCKVGTVTWKIGEVIPQKTGARASNRHTECRVLYWSVESVCLGRKQHVQKCGRSQYLIYSVWLGEGFS